MKLRNNVEEIACIKVLHEFGLLNGYEIEFLNRLSAPDAPFDKAIELAETMHLHIKVDDMRNLPVNQFFDAGARLDRQKINPTKMGCDLRLPDMYNAESKARLRGATARYAFKAKRWRRFDRNYALPDNVIPFGDAICKLNPLYG